MEQTYKKMIEEKDDREYLIARLEWKIKQLAASLQDQNLSFIEQLQRWYNDNIHYLVIKL